MHETKRASPYDLISTYFVRTSHVTRIKNFFSDEPQTLTYETDFTAEI